jgi:hypothetical protein
MVILPKHLTRRMSSSLTVKAVVEGGIWLRTSSNQRKVSSMGV